MTAEPEPQQFRTRTLLHMQIDGYDDTVVMVDHVYTPEGMAGTCKEDDCDNDAHDPGLVGLFVSNDEDTDVSMLLTPAEALILAERLQRGAALVLESEEELPDLDREAAWYASRTEPTV